MSATNQLHSMRKIQNSGLGMGTIISSDRQVKLLVLSVYEFKEYIFIPRGVPDAGIFILKSIR